MSIIIIIALYSSEVLNLKGIMGAISWIKNPTPASTTWTTTVLSTHKDLTLSI